MVGSFITSQKNFSITIFVNIRAPASFKCPQEEKYWSPCTTFSRLWMSRAFL